MFTKHLSALLLAALLLGGCSTAPTTTSTDPMTATKEKVSSLLDASLWTVPYSIEGGEGLSFSLPEMLTYAGGGDTDSSSTSWVSEKVGEGSGDVYFSITSFVLMQCPAEDLGCGLGDTVPATPEEVFDVQVKNFSAQENCQDQGEVSVGGATGHAFSCDSPAQDLVLLYSSKGAYKVQNELGLLTGDAELSAGVFENFFGTIELE